MQEDNPYQASPATASSSGRGFPWCATVFNILALCGLLTVGIAFGGMRHPERLVLVAIMVICLPIAISALLAAAIQVFFRQSPIRHRFHFILSFSSVVMGCLVLLFGAFGITVELGYIINVVPSWF
jgi:hypothetical protein